MSIIVKCDSCQKQFRAKNSAQGKKTKCPKCKVPLLIEGHTVPDYDVFVSHSSKDEAAANQVLHNLEQNKVRCWIAPRDIKGGANWSSAIIDAIENSRVMVLIYSSHSNLSQQVLREVERAVAKQLVIVPFRIDDVPMTQEMEYYLSTSHWLDAINGPNEQELDRLTKSVASLLETEDTSASPRMSSSGFPSATTASSKSSFWIAGVSGVVLIIGLALVFFAGQLFSNPNQVELNTAEASASEENETPLFDAQFQRQKKNLEKLIFENVSPNEWISGGGTQSLMFFDSVMLVSASERTHR